MKKAFYTVAVCAIAALTFLQPSRAADNELLTVAYPGFSTSALLTYLADGAGFFKQLGLDVKILDGQGATTLTLVVSGQADLYGAGSISAQLATSAKGLSTTLVYAVAGGVQTGYTVGNPKTAATVEALGKLDTCRINTFSSGTTTYAFAVILKQKYAPKCEIVPFSEVPSAIASVVSNHGDAIVASFSSLSSAIVAKQVVPIIDTRDAVTTEKLFGPPFIESAVWGLTDNLAKKRSAVVKFIRASILALEWAKTHSDEDAAKVLQAYPGFKTEPLASLTEQVAAARAYLHKGSTDGRINQEQWQRQLDFLISAGMVPDPKSAENSYAKRVDMSYFDAANTKN